MAHPGVAGSWRRSHPYSDLSGGTATELLHEVRFGVQAAGGIYDYAVKVAGIGGL